MLFCLLGGGLETTFIGFRKLKLKFSSAFAELLFWSLGGSERTFIGFRKLKLKFSSAFAEFSCFFSVGGS